MAKDETPVERLARHGAEAIAQLRSELDRALARAERAEREADRWRTRAERIGDLGSAAGAALNETTGTVLGLRARAEQAESALNEERASSAALRERLAAWGLDGDPAPNRFECLDCGTGVRADAEMCCMTCGADVFYAEDGRPLSHTAHYDPLDLFVSGVLTYWAKAGPEAERQMEGVFATCKVGVRDGDPCLVGTGIRIETLAESGDIEETATDLGVDVENARLAVQAWKRIGSDLDAAETRAEQAERERDEDLESAEAERVISRAALGSYAAWQSLLAEAERERDEARREVCEHEAAPSEMNPLGCGSEAQAAARGWSYLYEPRGDGGGTDSPERVAEFDRAMESADARLDGMTDAELAAEYPGAVEEFNEVCGRVAAERGTPESAPRCPGCRHPDDLTGGYPFRCLACGGWRSAPPPKSGREFLGAARGIADAFTVEEFQELVDSIVRLFSGERDDG